MFKSALVSNNICDAVDCHFSNAADNCLLRRRINAPLITNCWSRCAWAVHLHAMKAAVILLLISFKSIFFMSLSCSADCMAFSRQVFHAAARCCVFMRAMKPPALLFCVFIEVASCSHLRHAVLTLRRIIFIQHFLKRSCVCKLWEVTTTHGVNAANSAWLFHRDTARVNTKVSCSCAFLNWTQV